MRVDPVQETLRQIASELDANEIAYAVCGGMSLVAHGYLHTTEMVEILVTADGLTALHQALDGRGYLRPSDSSRNLRNTLPGVQSEFFVAGQYPGDETPKTIAFPEPAAVTDVIDGIRYVNLPTLINLKLASGMSNAPGLRDLADVQELIRALGLKSDFAAELDSSVRGKFDELRLAVEAADTA